MNKKSCIGQVQSCPVFIHSIPQHQLLLIIILIIFLCIYAFFQIQKITHFIWCYKPCFLSSKNIFRAPSVLEHEWFGWVFVVITTVWGCTVYIVLWFIQPIPYCKHLCPFHSSIIANNTAINNFIL